MNCELMKLFQWSPHLKALPFYMPYCPEFSSFKTVTLRNQFLVSRNYNIKEKYIYKIYALNHYTYKSFQGFQHLRY